MLRACFVLVGLLASLQALAGEMTVADARRFIVGKMFHYTCFEGTRGQGLVYPDGSVAGSIQIRGSGQMRYAVLPPGTIRVNGEAVCASVRGVPIHPCFNIEQTGGESFRGSISGLGFAYCDFTRWNERAQILQRAEHRVSPAERTASPMALRPSLAAGRGE
jgi:hypothetical protein